MKTIGKQRTLSNNMETIRGNLRHVYMLFYVNHIFYIGLSIQSLKDASFNGGDKSLGIEHQERNK